MSWNITENAAAIYITPKNAFGRGRQIRKKKSPPLASPKRRIADVFYNRRIAPSIIYCCCCACLSPSMHKKITAKPSASEIDNAVLQGRLEERLQALEQRAQEQAELSLGRLETVEGRIEGVDRHISQVLLIFGLATVMIFFLMISSLRAQQRLSAEQVSRTVREAQGLMNDIRQELSRRKWNTACPVTCCGK